MPTTALPSAWPATAASGDGNERDAEHLVQPHEEQRVQRRGRHEHHEPRQRRGHDELLADGAGQKPDDRLRQPADADDAARQRILNQPGHAAGQHARSPARWSAPRRRRRRAPDRRRPSRPRRTAPASSAARAPARSRSRTPAAFTRAASSRLLPCLGHGARGGVSRPRAPPRAPTNRRRATTTLAVLAGAALNRFYLTNQRSPWGKCRRCRRSRRGPQP